MGVTNRKYCQVTAWIQLPRRRDYMVFSRTHYRERVFISLEVKGELVHYDFYTHIGIAREFSKSIKLCFSK